MISIYSCPFLEPKTIDYHAFHPQSYFTLESNISPAEEPTVINKGISCLYFLFCDFFYFYLISLY